VQWCRSWKARGRAADGGEQATTEVERAAANGRRGATSQGGKGRGGQAKGEKGGWRPREGKREKRWPPRVLWEKETTPQMTSDFASNGPQPFPSSTHRKSTFGQHFFWDITDMHTQQLREQHVN
jgi:hypothetical protein